jgi:hypothetical protein
LRGCLFSTRLQLVLHQDFPDLRRAVPDSRSGYAMPSRSTKRLRGLSPSLTWMRTFRSSAQDYSLVGKILKASCINGTKMVRRSTQINHACLLWKITSMSFELSFHLLHTLKDGRGSSVERTECDPSIHFS